MLKELALLKLLRPHFEAKWIAAKFVTSLKGKVPGSKQPETRDCRHTGKNEPLNKTQSQHTEGQSHDLSANTLMTQLLRTQTWGVCKCFSSETTELSGLLEGFLFYFVIYYSWVGVCHREDKGQLLWSRCCPSTFMWVPGISQSGQQACMAGALFYPLSHFSGYQSG